MRARPDRSRRSRVRSEAKRLLRELPSFLKLLYRLLRDARVPAGDKLLFGAVMAYVLTPADLLPDFLGFFGLVDDLYLLGLSLSRMLARAGSDTLLEHWDGDPRALGYLIEGVDQLGEMLPHPIRSVLRRSAGESPDEEEDELEDEEEVLDV